jgi:hypothetical protein
VYLYIEHCHRVETQLQLIIIIIIIIIIGSCSNQGFFQITISWAVTPCYLSLVADISEEHVASILCREDGLGMFLRNIFSHIQNYKASQPRDQNLNSCSPRRVIVCSSKSVCLLNLMSYNYGIPKQIFDFGFRNSFFLLTQFTSINSVYMKFINLGRCI